MDARRPLATCGALALLLAGGCSRAPLAMPDVEGPCRQRMNALVLGGPELDELRNLFPVERIAPSHPWLARLRGIQGWGCVDADVQEDGSVADVRVIDARPSAEFGAAARAAVQRWKYPPRGKPGVRTVFVFLSFAIPTQ